MTGWVMYGEPVRGRQCGSCTACCTIVPVELAPGRYKPAGARCPHLSAAKRCTIYANRPDPCRYWSCAWLIHDDTGDLKRPDLAGVIIDCSIDQIIMEGEQRDVIQVWVDPKRWFAYRESAVLDYLSAMFDKYGLVALIRHSNKLCFTLFPPQLTRDGWIEVGGTMLAEGEVQAKLKAEGKFHAPVLERVVEGRIDVRR